MVTSNLCNSSRTSFITGALALGGICAVLHPACAQDYLVTNLDSNVAGVGTLDPNLLNPWGISESGSSPFWVSINGPTDAASPTGFQTPGMSTLYNTTGTPLHIVPTASGVPSVPGTPTGQVNNPNGAQFGGAHFIFASLDGTISGWSGGNSAIIQVTSATSNSAVYTGLGLSNGLLYAANSNTGGGVDVYNSNYQFVKTVNDPSAPAGDVPFNVQNLKGTLYVTYVDNPNTPTTGFVDTYDPVTGNFTRVTTGVTSLVGPWGLQIAPSNFGIYSNDLLVGDNATGEIIAFNSNGTQAGVLDDPDGNPIIEPNLWGIQFGNGGSGGNTNELYFASTVANEPGDTGLFGSIAAVPEPSAYAAFGSGLLVLGGIAMKAKARKRKNG